MTSWIAFLCISAFASTQVVTSVLLELGDCEEQHGFRKPHETKVLLDESSPREHPGPRPRVEKQDLNSGL